jgi:putative tricarboxylic transport membrane protein
VANNIRSINSHRLADLAVLLLLAGLVTVYCVDAIRASTEILNLILVVPVAVAILALCLAQFVLGVSKLRAEEEPKEPVSDVVPITLLFAAYILTLPWLGFDVGTSLFIAVCLWWHGERRWPWVLAYSISFAFALAYFFSSVLPYPMPMLILNTI